MTELTPRERELVALGAAIGSNCAPCLEFHLPEARTAGLNDAEIQTALELADAVRSVAARHALATAHATLGAPTLTTSACQISPHCC